MAFLTLANAKLIINMSNINKLDLSGEIYKVKIYFYSKYEENQLLAIIELLKDPENYFNEIYEPFKPIDTYSYMYEGQNPAYHYRSNCPRLNSDYENFKIPEAIKEKGSDVVKDFRKWFESVKHLLEKPDVFVMRLKSRWGIETNPKAINFKNSGSSMILYSTIEELEKEIDEKLKEADRFCRQSKKNEEILRKFSKLTFLAKRNSPIYSNKTQYSDDEIKSLLAVFNGRFKRPLMLLLIEYFKFKFNPEIKMDGKFLRKLGFKPCSHCHDEIILINENYEDLDEQDISIDDDFLTSYYYD